MVFVVSVPASAWAAESAAETRVYTVTGAQIASQVASGLSSLDIGSGATTITVDIEGTPTQIPVTYSSVLDADANRGLTSFALLGLAAGAVLKFLGLLLRLGR